ncbi:hypothetical protein Pse7367_3478 [Thalassoporum mexicanum PCC 7367]|uniref:hypothetical protein n=1 Tax=Thalassoporum mexicanum TaxID=3457544 RepID=UPI00029FF8ED|nr:hypothetical protein [Pseudanabaena sp. PCC 7367]AFY71714.1 hypothetical protein Pse7367_3478 [Pseudanabaena sp. PCC 7367]
MNTPSHAIVNLSCFSVLAATHHNSLGLAIAFGAVLPDLPIFGMYFWAKWIKRQPEREIWGITYELPLWQNLVAAFHSIPLAMIGATIAYWAGASVIGICLISAVLHSLFDLPVHNSDAHRHFYPFSNYRFISPLSYWDPKHYGLQVSIVERCLVLALCGYLWPGADTAIARGILIIVVLLYLASLVISWRWWQKRRQKKPLDRLNQ